MPLLINRESAGTWKATSNMIKMSTDDAREFKRIKHITSGPNIPMTPSIIGMRREMTTKGIMDISICLLFVSTSSVTAKAPTYVMPA